jgi:hypothetical protein
MTDRIELGDAAQDCDQLAAKFLETASRMRAAPLLATGELQQLVDRVSEDKAAAGEVQRQLERALRRARQDPRR